MKVIAIAVVLAALAVSGCKTAEERQAALNAHDDETCKSYGAKPGTDVYTQCRMLVAQSRAQQEAVDQAALSAYLQNTGAAILAANRPRPTYTTTNCRRIGVTVHCTSY